MPLARVEGHSVGATPQWGVRRRRKWQVNVKVKWRFPRTPSCFRAAVRAAAMRGGSGCSGFFSISAKAEGILRKIAARAPLRLERQPHRLGGTGVAALAFTNDKQTSIRFLADACFSLRDRNDVIAITGCRDPPAGSSRPGPPVQGRRRIQLCSCTSRRRCCPLSGPPATAPRW